MPILNKKSGMNDNLGKYLAGILILLLTIVLGLTVVLSCVPPVSRDALVHHLAIPKIYLEHGKIIELPCMVYSYYPMNLDMLYLAALYCGSDIAPKFIHAFFGLMTALLIYFYIKKRTNQIYALGGALLFLSLPIIIKLSITVYVDLGLVFFSFASLLLLLKWIDTNFNLFYLVCSGICCGLAMGIKYNGLIVFFLFTMFVPYIYSKFSIEKSFVKSIQYGAVYILICLTLFSPWMIRNHIWKNNPVYPLYNKFFDLKADNPCITSLYREGKNINIDVLTYRTLMYEERWWEIALIPVRIFFQGKDNDLKNFDGKLSVLLFFFPVFAFKRSDFKYRHEKKIFLIFVVLFFLFVSFNAVLRLRYIAPIIPPLVILTIFGMKNCIDLFLLSSKELLGKISIFIILIGIGYQLISSGTYLKEQFQYVKPFQFITGKANKDQYITMFRHEYPLLQYINQNLPDSAKILFFYMGNRGYYCNKSYIADMNSNILKLFDMLETKSITKVSNWYKTNGITHFAMNHLLVKKMVNSELDEVGKRRFLNFISNFTINIVDNNGFELYELK